MASGSRCKRQRGWELEVAKSTPCQKDEEQNEEGSNPLCQRLLQLWSQGRLSATQVAELAHLAMLSGCQHKDLLDLAKCGSFGSNVGNCHRDMTTLCCKNMRLPEPKNVNVPMFDLKTQKEITGEAAVLLPHLLFSNLHENYPEEFDRLFCPHDSSAFWHGVEGAKDPRLVEPLAKSGKVLSPSKTIPIYIHGDGCEFHSRDSLVTWSWGCLLCKDKALQSHLLICAMPKSCSLPTTWQNIDMWLAWSLTALTKGIHPTKDPWNNPLPEGVLKDMAGKPLTKGNHRCAVWAIQGDQEFYSNVLKLGHWSSKHPCHECDCQKATFKKTPCPLGKSWKIIKQEEQQFEYISPQQALLAKRSNHPLFTIPGVSTSLVRGDALHILYSRGVGAHLAGSLLHYICYFDWPKRQAVNPSKRLQLIFEKIKEQYTLMQVSSRLNNLRLSMITEPDKPHKGYPVLEAKAAEVKHFLPCLQRILADVLDDDDAVHVQMMDCLKAFNELVALFDSIGAFPTPGEFDRAENLAKRFFDQYSDLHDWALTKGRKLFNKTFKTHTMHHMIRNSKYLNFRLHQNYRAEDFVGQISVIGHSISFGNKATRVCQKLSQKYLVLLHLQLCKPGFGHAAEDDCDP